MLRRLYDTIMDLSARPFGLWVLAAVAFAESSFFPIPPDLVLVPMVLADRSRGRFLALWCTLWSVAGGILGYLIGWLLYDSVGNWLISAYGAGDKIDAFRDAYAQWGALVILIKGLTPIPYKIVTIASGFAGYDFALFILLSIVTRGLRFLIVAELLRYFGEPIRDFIEKRLTLVTTGFLLVVIGGFLLARYTF